ncbi:MAG: hypothetical protein Q7S02_02020 [bacterium]|nr:hypothetical protein [bacterium]
MDRDLQHLSNPSPEQIAMREVIATADQLIGRGEYNRAERVLTEHLATHPTNIDAMRRIADIAATQGDAKQAVTWYLRMAAIHGGHSDFGSALGCLDRARKIDGILLEDRIEITLWSGRIWEVVGKPETALGVYRVALAITPRPQTAAMRIIEQRAQALEEQGVVGRRRWVAVPAECLKPLIGVVALGGDAVEDCKDGGAEEDHSLTAEENARYWSEWAKRDDGEPLSDDDEIPVKLIMRLLQYFATLAGPKFDGPREAVRGFAECSEALGVIGPATEAYEALLNRACDDDKPSTWVEEIRTHLTELRTAVRHTR